MVTAQKDGWKRILGVIRVSPGDRLKPGNRDLGTSLAF
jgi:hypothetical protein